MTNRSLRGCFSSIMLASMIRVLRIGGRLTSIEGRLGLRTGEIWCKGDDRSGERVLRSPTTLHHTECG